MHLWRLLTLGGPSTGRTSWSAGSRGFWTIWFTERRFFLLQNISCWRETWRTKNPDTYPQIRGPAMWRIIARERFYNRNTAFPHRRLIWQCMPVDERERRARDHRHEPPKPVQRFRKEWLAIIQRCGEKEEIYPRCQLSSTALNPVRGERWSFYCRSCGLK